MASFNIYYTEGTKEGAGYILSNSSMLSRHKTKIKHLSTSQVSGMGVYQTSPKLLQILTLDKPDYIITNPDQRDDQS